MCIAEQLTLFDISPKINRLEQASTTFIDNMKLPVHRWFRYTAGFSAEWVKKTIRQYAKNGSMILDPFAGSGTTLVAANELCLPSIGFDPKFIILLYVMKLDIPQKYRQDVENAVLLLKSEGCLSVYLFGSLVMGTYHENSDIDIGIKGLPRGNFLRVYAKLDNILSNAVDLVDFDANHKFYNLLNSLIKNKDRDLPSGIRWHKELLDKAFEKMENRTALFRAELKEPLDKYLKFRHLVRHIYGFQLEWEDMKDILFEMNAI